MKRTKWISRHAPEMEQSAALEAAGFMIVSVGDMDAFDERLEFMLDEEGIEAVFAVHPAISTAAVLSGRDVITVKNDRRQEPDGPPTFVWAGFKVFPIDGDAYWIKPQ